MCAGPVPSKTEDSGIGRRLIPGHSMASRMRAAAELQRGSTVGEWGDTGEVQRRLLGWRWAHHTGCSMQTTQKLS